jgi:hypothetical protein
LSTKVKSDELAIEFDGPEVTPDTLDARVALELASAYLDLLQQIATDAGQEIRFSGLRVEDKCAAIVTETSAPRLTKRAANQATKYISAPGTARSRIAERAERVRRVLNRMPEKTHARVFVGTWNRSLAVKKPPDVGPPIRAAIRLRVRVLRVGGDDPTVRFESGSEARPFSLSVTRETAKQLAAYLYDELDIVAHVTRDADDHIDGGALDEFSEVEQAGSLEAWRRWHRENVPEWDEVESLEEELGRDRS